MSPSSESASDPGGRGGGRGASPRADGSREQPPVVPGLVLRARLRDAGAGRVWAGRVESTGVECTVRHLPLPPVGPARDEVVRAAEKLVELRHPHLVTVTDVISHDDGLAVVTQPVPGAISLGRLLGVRERIEPGEVVTVGLPVAQALAAAHAVQVVHGSLTSEDILLEPNGRPVLAGVGLAGLLRLTATPEDDVRDLADLLLDTMLEATGPDAAAVAVAVATALVDDPRQRPTAAELAAALGRSCPPLAVRLVSEPIAPLLMPPPPPGVDPEAVSSRARSSPPAVPPESPGSPDVPDVPDVPDAPDAPVAGLSESDAAAFAAGAASPPASGLPDADGSADPGLPWETGLPDGTDVSNGSEWPAGSASDPENPPGTPRPLGRPRPLPMPRPPRPPGSPGRRDQSSRPRPRQAGGPPPVTSARRQGFDPGPEGVIDPGVRLSEVPNPPEPNSESDRFEATLLLRGPGSPTDSSAGTRRVAGKRPVAATPTRSPRTSGRPPVGRGGPPNAGGSRPSRPGAGHSARRPRAGARPRGGRWVVPAITLAGVVVVTVAAFALIGGSSKPSAPNQAQPVATSGTATAASNGGVESNPVGAQTAEQRWQAELEALLDARANAFQGADENALTLVDAVDSSAHAQDLAKMRQMVGLGAHAVGLRSVVESVEVRDEGSEVTVLRVTDRQEPYSFLAADGTVLSEQPGKPAQTRDITLVSTPDGWRIATVADVAS